MKRHSLAIVAALAGLPVAAVVASSVAAHLAGPPPFRALYASDPCGTGNSGSGNSGTSNAPMGIPGTATGNSGTGNSGYPCQFTVTGSIPVPANSSQDTWTKGLTCSTTEELAARTAGFGTIHLYFKNLPQSAALLTDFLKAAGTAVGYPDGSGISAALKKDPAFTGLNSAVNAQIASDLSKGISHIVLKPPLIYTLTIGDKSGNTGAQELYYGFRGTQGLQISGGGTYSGSNYKGQLSYVIQDSYGFTTKDVFLGVGTLMRYLQTNCGYPHYKLGAHWFPDSITADIDIHN